MAPRKLSESFEKSYKLATYLQNASNDEMLDLYAFANIAKQDKDLATAKKPGMFDIAGKKKRERWEQYVNQDPPLKPEEAEKAYVEKVSQLVAAHGLKDTCPAELK